MPRLCIPIPLRLIRHQLGEQNAQEDHEEEDEQHPEQNGQQDVAEPVGAADAFLMPPMGRRWPWRTTVFQVPAGRGKNQTTALTR